jgi:hypothetical protein
MFADFEADGIAVVRDFITDALFWSKKILWTKTWTVFSDTLLWPFWSGCAVAQSESI